MTTFLKMTRRAATTTALALTAALALPTGTFAKDMDEITLGALRFVSHGAGFVAFEKGYFAQEGINLKFKFFQAAQPIAVAIASGDVDFGVTGVTGGLMSLAEKNAIRIVGGVLHETKGTDGEMILASNKAYETGLKTVDDMPSHSIGVTDVGSTFHYITRLIAQDKGWSMDDFKLVALHKVGAMIAAIKSGQTDIMIMVPHIAKELVQSGAVKKIGQVNDYAEWQISTIVTSVDNIENNRDMVERFIRAYSRGIEDIHNVMLNPEADPADVEAMTKMIHKYVYADRPFEKAAPYIQAGIMYLNKGAALDKTSVEQQMDWFVSEGLVRSGLSVDQLVDSSFVETY